MADSSRREKTWKILAKSGKHKQKNGITGIGRDFTSISHLQVTRRETSRPSPLIQFLFV
jgi:hypothetical protein